MDELIEEVKTLRLVRDNLARENAEFRAGYARLQGYFRRVISLGHNEDCLFCGFKDKCATIALAETPAASLEAIRAEAKAEEREACAEIAEIHSNHAAAHMIRARGDAREAKCE